MAAGARQTAHGAGDRHRRLRHRRDDGAAAAGDLRTARCPQEDRGKIFSWSNRMVGYDERDPDDDDGMVASGPGGPGFAGRCHARRRLAE